MNWYKIARLSDEIKTQSRKAWYLLHRDSSDSLCIDRYTDIDKFIELSTFIRDLTDTLDRMPRLDEVCRLWLIDHESECASVYSEV